MLERGFYIMEHGVRIGFFNNQEDLDSGFNFFLDRGKSGFKTNRFEV